MNNQISRDLNQFNIQNKISLFSADFPMVKLLVVWAIALLIFLSIFGLVILKLI